MTDSKMSHYSSLCIALEGPWGGTTELIGGDLLRWCHREGIPAQYLKCTTYSLFGSKRPLPHEEISRRTALILEVTKIFDYYHTVIAPLLQASTVLILEQHILSRLAALQLNVDELHWITTLLEPLMPPDYTFVVRASPLNCIRHLISLHGRLVLPPTVRAGSNPHLSFIAAHSQNEKSLLQLSQGKTTTVLPGKTYPSHRKALLTTAGPLLLAWARKRK
jgi:hypothetical protein